MVPARNILPEFISIFIAGNLRAHLLIELPKTLCAVDFFLHVVVSFILHFEALFVELLLKLAHDVVVVNAPHCVL